MPFLGRHPESRVSDHNKTQIGKLLNLFSEVSQNAPVGQFDDLVIGGVAIKQLKKQDIWDRHFLEDGSEYDPKLQDALRQSVEGNSGLPTLGHKPDAQSSRNYRNTITLKPVNQSEL